MHRSATDVELAEISSDSSIELQADVSAIGGIEYQRKRRKRATTAQLVLLERHFASDTLPSNDTRAALAERLGMSPRRVQIWFQNKRAKNKRIQRETQQHRQSSEDAMSSRIPTEHPITIRGSTLLSIVQAAAPSMNPIPSVADSSVWPQQRTLPSLSELHLAAAVEPRRMDSPIMLPPLRNLTDQPQTSTALGNVTTLFSRPQYYLLVKALVH